MRVPGVVWLLVLAGGLAGGLWLTQRRPGQTGEVTDAVLDGRRLLDAERILVQRSPDARVIHLAQPGAGQPWMVVEPVVDLANPAVLRAMAGAYDTAQRFFVDDVAKVEPDLLRQMGLDPPQGMLEVRYKDRTIHVDIGERGPLGDDLFVRMDGRVYRAGLALQSSIQANVGDIRLRQVSRSHPDDVRRVSLRRRGEDGKVESLTVERGGLDGFRITEPIQAAASPDAGNGLFALVTALRVDQFLDALNPMPEPDLVIEIEGGFGVENVAIWRTEAGIIGHAEPRGIDFSVRGRDYDSLIEVPARDLRARTMVPLALAEMTRIEVDPPGATDGQRLQLRRSPDGSMRVWQPVERVAEPAAVNDLLLALGALQATEFVDLAAADVAALGLGGGFTTVAVHAEERRESVVLHVGTDVGDATWLRRAGESYAVKVPRQQADILRRGWIEYVGLDVLGMPEGTALRELRLLRGDEEMVRYWLGDDRRWQRQPPGGPGSERVADVADLLVGLRGRRALDLRVPHTRAGLRLEFGREPGERLGQLLLLLPDDAEQPLWVRLPGDERVGFELRALDSDALRLLLPAQ